MLTLQYFARKMKLLLVVGVICCCAWLPITSGRKNLAAYCGACKAIVDELSYEVKKVDPKKTIQVSGRENAALRYIATLCADWKF